MRRLLTLLSLFVCLLPTLALAHGEDPHNALLIEAGAEEHGNVSTVDQPIVINGVVYGDVTSIAGDIIVRGVIEGDVVTWGGDVRLEPAAQVKGSIMAVAGAVRNEGQSMVAGQVFNGNLERAGFASLIPGVARGPLPLSTRLNLALALLVIGVALAALLSHIWVRSIQSASLVLQQFLPRTTILGLLTAVLSIVAAGMLMLLLTFMLVGILVLPALLIVVHLPFLAGTAAVGRGIEEWLGVERGRGIIGTLLLLLPPFMLALWQPIAGLVGFYLIAAPGVGALLLLRRAALRFHQV